MSGAADSDADYAAIEAATAKLLAAVNASDVAGVLAVWAEDGILMPPHHPSVHGPEPIRMYFENLFSRMALSFAFTSSSIEVVGDTAFERVTFVVSSRPSDGPMTTEDCGKGLHVYRRQRNGSWQLIHDIWNSDQPAIAPPAVRDQRLGSA